MSVQRCRGRWGTLPAVVLGVGLCVGCTPRLVPSGPVVSPTGFVYELGTPPVDTRFSQTAVLYLRQDEVERALELALEGIESDPPNPIHYFLAGTAYARLGEVEAAGALLADAERIYPAYELDTEPEREQAWTEAFNEGIEAFDGEDVETAIDAWSRAALIYNLRPEAHRNLAVLFAGEGRYAEAIEMYEQALSGLDNVPATRVLPEFELAGRAELSLTLEENLAQLFLFSARYAEAEPLIREQLQREPKNLDLQRDLARTLTDLGRDFEATEIYISLLSTGTLGTAEIFSVGVALFNSADFVEAGNAFKQLTEFQPDSRDAWFNYANSLFAAEEWELLAAAGDQLLELDPLSESAGLIAARAYLEMGNEAAARSGLERTELLPIYVEGLRLRPGGEGTLVEGRVIGKDAEPGTSVRLRFTFFDDEGVLGREIFVVRALAAGESETLELSFAGRATAYRYEVLP